MLDSISHSSLFRFLMGRSTTTTPETDFHLIFPAMKTNVNRFSPFGSHVNILKVYLFPIIGYIKAFISKSLSFKLFHAYGICAEHFCSRTG